jgi:hypothetical protein
MRVDVVVSLQNIRRERAAVEGCRERGEEEGPSVHTFQVLKQTNDVLDHVDGAGYFSFNNRTPHHRHSRQDTPMRTSLSLRSSLTLAAFCAAAGSPVAAQQSAVAGNVRATVNASSASADAALPRTVAIYTFGASRSAGLPAQVTVVDSAGTWLANFRMPGATSVHPMVVDAREGDLYLQGDTSVGTLTLVLYPIETDATGAVIGRWSVGSAEGELLRGAKR